MSVQMIRPGWGKREKEREQETDTQTHRDGEREHTRRQLSGRQPRAIFFQLTRLA